MLTTKGFLQLNNFYCAIFFCKLILKWVFSPLGLNNQKKKGMKCSWCCSKGLTVYSSLIPGFYHFFLLWKRLFLNDVLEPVFLSWMTYVHTSKSVMSLSSPRPQPRPQHRVALFERMSCASKEISFSSEMTRSKMRHTAHRWFQQAAGGMHQFGAAVSRASLM